MGVVMSATGQCCRAVLIGLAALLGAAAQADNLSSLTANGWTTKDRGPPLLLEWHGLAAEDIIQAIITAPEAAAQEPAAMIEQRFAAFAKQNSVQNCTNPNNAVANTAVRLCQAKGPKGEALLIEMIAARDAAGKTRIVTLVSTGGTASRNRLAADQAQFVALALAQDQPSAAPTPSHADPVPQPAPQPAAVAVPTGTLGCGTDKSRYNSVCHIAALGWLIEDVGPPVRFKPGDGAQGLEIAVTGPAQLQGDPAAWGMAQLAGGPNPSGTSPAFPLTNCHGNMPAGAKVAVFDCTAPSGWLSSSKGALILVALDRKYQVIGVIAPGSADFGSLTKTRLGPVVKLIDDGKASGVAPWSARAALYGGRDYYLAPGKGVSPDRIEGVYHHYSWGVNFNMGMSDNGSDYIFLDNGDVWADPEASPQDVDIDKAKQAIWQKWGHWHRPWLGGDTIIQMNGERQEEHFSSNDLLRYEPAPRDQRVEGSWQSMSGGVMGFGNNTTSVVSTHTVTLHADGKFARDGFAGASFNNEIGNTRTGGTTMSNKPKRGGRYRIDRYSLVLDYDDGTRESDFFYWAGGKNPFELMMLNGGKYLGNGKG